MSDVFLRLENITKHFGGVKALQGVDFTIKPGEIHALAGENGSGKSTMIKIISGVHEPTSGKIYIEGEEITGLTPKEAIKYGIQVIYQDFAIFPNLTVAENIAMNQAVLKGNKFMKWDKARKLAVEAMEQIGANLDPDIPVERLSVAHKQMVAICRAIITDAKLLILDEPTTALTASEVDMLNDVIRRLKDKGMAIVIVNHKLDEIYEIADVLTVIRNGKTVAHGNIEDFDHTKFVYAMTGRTLKNEAYRPEQKDLTAPILKVTDLSSRDAFRDVSFDIYRGDVLGITGLLGSGRGAIGEALFGLQPIDSGNIVLNGEQIHINSVEDAVRNRIAYVPEDRLTQGLFLDRSIQDNTIAASIPDYMENFKLNYEKMYNDTEAWIDKIGCNAPSPLPAIRTLSGGNAQKMVIAKWLNTNPHVVVLNGPTVGVDVGSKQDIHEILHSLSRDGVGIIIISDDISELIQNCNKILVMRDGNSLGIFESEKLNEAKLAELIMSKGEE